MRASPDVPDAHGLIADYECYEVPMSEGAPRVCGTASGCGLGSTRGTRCYPHLCYVAAPYVRVPSMDIMDDNVLTLGIVDAASPRGARGGTHDGHFAFLKGYHVNTAFEHWNL